MAKENKDRSKAIQKALYGGAFGSHKFYLGQPGVGFIRAIFFWTLVPSIIAIIEMFILMRMSDDEFNRRYN